MHSISRTIENCLGSPFVPQCTLTFDDVHIDLSKNIGRYQFVEGWQASDLASCVCAPVDTPLSTNLVSPAAQCTKILVDIARVVALSDLRRCCPRSYLSMFEPPRTVIASSPALLIRVSL